MYDWSLSASRAHNLLEGRSQKGKKGPKLGICRGNQEGWLDGVMMLDLDFMDMELKYREGLLMATLHKSVFQHDYLFYF